MTRQSRLALLMIAPAVITAVALNVVEIWRVLRPRSELFATPFVYTLAEAIERHDVDRAYAFIRAGQDPNQPIAVARRGRSVLMPPLLWAVTTRNRDAVLMLVGFGARVDQAAVCLAEEIDSAEIARLLTRHGPVDLRVTCPPPPPTVESGGAAVPRQVPRLTPARPASPSR
jgi:hypothetical protein